jgi:hypothetical protein
MYQQGKTPKNLRYNKLCAKWTTMSKYQTQINQPNYLENMAVQNVLFV